MMENTTRRDFLRNTLMLGAGMGLQQALMIVRGTPCPGCEAGTCANV